MTTRWIGLAVCAAFLGCGGGSSEAAPAEHAQTEEYAEHAGHADLPPELNAMHDEIAPVWHSEPGETRAHLACENAEDLLARSEDVATGPVPEGQDPLEWRDAAGGMRDAASELLNACEAPNTAIVEERTHALHEAFHALKDRLHAHGA